MSRDFSQPAARPVDRSRPCWTCHWLAYLSGSGSVCMRPGSGNTVSADQGCAFWLREPGSDDEIHEGSPPAMPRPSPQVCMKLEAQKIKLHRLAERASQADCAPLVYVQVASRGGALELSYPTWAPQEKVEQVRANVIRMGLGDRLLPSKPWRTRAPEEARE